MAAIVVVIVVIVVNILVKDCGSDKGANDQHPMPHAAKGRPADDVTTVIVGFPQLSALSRNPFPSSASLYLWRIGWVLLLPPSKTITSLSILLVVILS
jgi:hypothetical protein